MLIIKPYGRLGNNIHQIINCIGLNLDTLHDNTIDVTCIKKIYPIILKNFPDFYYFDFQEKSEIIKKTFWGVKFNISIHDILPKYILPYVNYDIDKEQINNIDLKNDLIIHLRSGDIFDKSFPLDTYIQPPLCFYEHIIKNTQFEKIHIITENVNHNPVLQELQKKYKNVYFTPRSFDIDFSILIHSQNLVLSNSTLSDVICIFNTSKKNVYYSNVCCKHYDKNANYIHITTPEYYKIKFTSYTEKIYHLLNYKN